MINNYTNLARHFITSLATERRTQLYNDLLALDAVYKKNCNNTFYTFRNLKRVSHKHSERRKRIFHYTNCENNILTIQQIHEQHYFKNSYCCHVFINDVEYDYSLIEMILSLLKEKNTEIYQALSKNNPSSF